MKSILFLLLFSVQLIHCFAQQKKLDSLLAELNKNSSRDSFRLKLLNQVAQQYRYKNPDTGISLANEAILLAEKLNINLQEGYAYDNIGYCYYTKGEFTKSIDFHKKALTIFRKLDNKEMMSSILNRIGGGYLFLSDYSKGLEYLQEGLLIAEKINYKPGRAAITATTGLVYDYLGNYPKSLEYYFAALKIYNEIPLRNWVGATYYNIAGIYIKLKDYDKAIEYSFKSLKLSDSLDSPKGKANSYNSLGDAYTHLKNYSLALDYFKKALVLYKETNSTYNISFTLSSIAAIYNSAPDSVLQKENILPSQRFHTALRYQYDALHMAQSAKEMDNVSNQWKSLSDIYETGKIYDSAIIAYKQYVAIHDSISGDKKKQEITRKEMQYEAERKETVLNAEHSASLLRQKTQRNAIAAGAGILLAGSILSFIFYKRRKDALSKQKEAELKADISDTEMKALRAQMNPHFIFNSLNSISNYITKNNTKVADEYLTKFAKLMRMILENSEQKEVTLHEDLNALELYMQLEAMRMNNKFTYEINVDNNINQESTMIPPLILQPFVENSIWHGIAGKEGNGKITVHIQKEGNIINCIVEDDGIGRKKAALAIAGNEKKSLGVKITKERINIINKLKKPDAGIVYSDMVQGTRVEVKLPLIIGFN